MRQSYTGRNSSCHGAAGARGSQFRHSRDIHSITSLHIARPMLAPNEPDETGSEQVPVATTSTSMLVKCNRCRFHDIRNNSNYSAQEDSMGPFIRRHQDSVTAY